MGSLTTGADRASGHKLTGVTVHFGPPETLAEELECAVEAQMACKLGRVGPLENLGSHRIRDELTVGGTRSRVRLLLLSLEDDGFDLLCSHTHDACRRKDGILMLRVRGRGIEARQSVRFDVT